MIKARILVVDDEEDILDRICIILEKRIECNIEKAKSGEEALVKLKTTFFDVVLIDIKMPGLSGIDVMKQAKDLCPETKFLAISGYDSKDVANQALKAGAVDFLSKPQTAESISLKIKEILTSLGKYEPKK